MTLEEVAHDPPVGRGTWVRLLGLAVSLRLAWALLVPVVPTSDSVLYEQFSRVLATHGVYGYSPTELTAFWPVGTSFLYSLVYRSFGPGFVPIVGMNLVIGAAIVALTVVLARQWFGTRAAVAAGFLVACWPALIEFTTVLASELPFILMIMLAVVAWQKLPGPWWLAPSTGLFLACASLIRPTALLLLPILAIMSLAASVPWRRTLRWSIIAGVVLVACITPWSVRNTRLFGRPVLLSTNGGTNTWMETIPSRAASTCRLPRRPG